MEGSQLRHGGQGGRGGRRQQGVGQRGRGEQGLRGQAHVAEQSQEVPGGHFGVFHLGS